MSGALTEAKAALAFLDRLESLEARLLAWGLTDGSFTEHEVLTHADQFLGELDLGDDDPPFWSGEDLLEWLLDKCLLWELPILSPEEPRYRSRVAEGVRLMSSLRQTFSAERWRASPRPGTGSN